MLREKFALATLVLLFFSLLVAGSGGIWLFLQPPLAPQEAGATFLGLAPPDVLSILMVLSLLNLLLLGLAVALQWPLLRAGAATLLPHPTARGLATGAVALVALVLLTLPWLTPRGTVPVPPPATEIPAPTVLPPAPTPTTIPEARPATTRPAKPSRLARTRHRVARPRLAAAHPRWGYRRPPLHSTWAKKPRRTCPRLSSAPGRLLARY